LEDTPHISTLPPLFQPLGIFKLKNTGFVDLEIPFSTVSSDAFILENPLLQSMVANITNVGGNLYIQDNPQLVSGQFFRLTQISGSLNISGCGFTSMPGFPILSTADTVSITNNSVLHDLDGFPAATMGDLIVEGNDMLLSVSGLCGSSITRHAYIGGISLCCEAVNRIIQPILSGGAQFIQLECLTGGSSISGQGWADCADNNYFTCLCPSLDKCDPLPCRDNGVDSTCVGADHCNCNLEDHLSIIRALRPELALYPPR